MDIRKEDVEAAFLNSWREEVWEVTVGGNRKNNVWWINEVKKAIRDAANIRIIGYYITCLERNILLQKCN